MRHLKEQDYQELLKWVKDAKEDSKMGGAEFGSMDGKSEMEPGEDASDFIRRETELYRNSWITGPLKQAVEILTERTRRD